MGSTRSTVSAAPAACGAVAPVPSQRINGPRYGAAAISISAFCLAAIRPDMRNGSTWARFWRRSSCTHGTTLREDAAPNSACAMGSSLLLRLKRFEGTPIRCGHASLTHSRHCAAAIIARSSCGSLQRGMVVGWVGSARVPLRPFRPEPSGGCPGAPLGVSLRMNRGRLVRSAMAQGGDRSKAEEGRSPGSPCRVLGGVEPRCGRWDHRRIGDLYRVGWGDRPEAGR